MALLTDCGTSRDFPYPCRRDRRSRQNRKSGESENAATLNNLRDAVNRDHLFAQTVALFVDHLIFTLSLSHFALP